VLPIVLRLDLPKRRNTLNTSLNDPWYPRAINAIHRASARKLDNMLRHIRHISRIDDVRGAEFLRHLQPTGDEVYGHDLFYFEVRGAHKCCEADAA
jgi:hypothetical protein